MRVQHGTVLNRSTFEVLFRVSLVNYPERDWVHDPDFSAVTKQDGTLWEDKYWILTRDVLTLMDQEERDVVDATEDAAALARARAVAKGRWDNDRALISLANVAAPKLTPAMTPAALVAAIQADIDVT